MKKLVTEYVYPKNGAALKIYAVRNIKRVPSGDTLLVEVIPASGEKVGFYLRPDEALLMIRMLAEAVNRTTKGYLFGLQRGKGKKY